MKPVDFIALSGFLLTAFQWRGALATDIRLVYLIPILLLVWSAARGHFKVQGGLLVFISLFALTSALGVAAQTTTLSAAGLQIVGISAFGFGFYGYISARQDRLPMIAQWFFNLMLGVAVFAIVQEAAFLVGITPLYDVNWLIPGVGMAPLSQEGPFLRVYSVFTEPGHLGIAIAPAGFIAVRVIFFGGRLYYTRLQAWLVVLAIILTFSTVAYFGLLVSFLVAGGRRRAVRATALAGLALAAALLTNAGVRERLFTLAQLFQGLDVEGGSVSALNMFLNAGVALQSLQQQPLWGGGFGSHFFTYETFLREGAVYGEGLLSFLSFMSPADLNTQDAYSMYLRLPSELGLLGVGVVLFFIIKNRLPEEAGQLAVVSSACLVFFITYCLREGHYFRHELWFFVALYAYLPVAWHRLRDEASGLSLPVLGAGVSTGLGAQTPASPLSANVRETRSTQRIRVGRRQRKRTCWDCEREWKRMVVPLEPGRPSEARQLLRTQR